MVYYWLMYPEDTVLVAYVPHPADFDRIRQEGWYRIPQRHAPQAFQPPILLFILAVTLASRNGPFIITPGGWGMNWYTAPAAAP
jgi:hypothetical protein